MRSRPSRSRSVPEPFDFDDADPGEVDSRVSLREWIGYAAGAIRRRKVVAAILFACGILLTVVYYARARPMYEVETKILAQRQLALPSAVRSGGGGDPPTRTAEELILRRDSILDVIKRADLVGGTAEAPDWSAHALAVVKHALGLGPDPATVDPLSAMVARLEKALVVTATDETVKISVRWPDPVQAYQIVEGALQNFLEARQAQEITAIDEAVALLQSRLASLRSQLDREESKRDDARRDEPSLPDVSSAPRMPAGAPASPELTRLRSLIDAKERAIRDMEDFRQRRLLELQAQLSEKRNVYAEAHPVVIGLRKEVEAFSLESPQIAALREQERQLRQEYAAQAASEGGRTRPEPRASPSRASREVRGNAQEDRVKDVRAQYLHMLERVNAVQLELDGARAAFRHRYSVIRPAELPREPVSPNPLKLFPLGLLASAFVALLAAVLPDVWSRRIFENWQVERELGLEVLSDLGPGGRR